MVNVSAELVVEVVLMVTDSVLLESPLVADNRLLPEIDTEGPPLTSVYVYEPVGTVVSVAITALRATGTAAEWKEGVSKKRVRKLQQRRDKTVHGRGQGNVGGSSDTRGGGRIATNAEREGSRQCDEKKAEESG